jgi:hypothetical protein
MSVTSKRPNFSIKRAPTKVTLAPMARRSRYVPPAPLTGGGMQAVAAMPQDESAAGGMGSITQMVREQSQRDLADGIDIVTGGQGGAISTAQVEWDMGYRNVSWTPHEMQINWEMERPKISVNPHSIEIKLSRYPMLKITFNPEYFEMQRKRKKVDQKI